jgi:hypothetical protein
MILAIVNVLPVPVAQRRVILFFHSEKLLAICLIAFG